MSLEIIETKADTGAMVIGETTEADAPIAGGSLSVWLLRRFLGSFTDFGEPGRLTVILPGGGQIAVGSGAGGAIWRIRRQRALWRLIGGGAMGFAEGYMAGDWDSPDLLALLLFFARALQEDGTVDAGRARGVGRLLDTLGHRLRRNSLTGSRRNIAAHYDLGNDFYRLWLDSGMTYSAALFETPSMSLAAAQQAKYRALAKGLALAPGMTVLEIGCGWGGFAEFAARHHGCRVTGITLSARQLDYARARVEKAGLSERVTLLLADYRQLTGQFDRVASIEMFEAVGEGYWPAYCRAVAGALNPGGRAGLQIITIGGRHFAAYRRGADFIQKYIFPGGMLPTASIVGDQFAAAGLALEAERRFAADYARTLGAWRQRFDTAWPDIAALGFDERYRRMWRYYLDYCAAGFTSGRIDVGQYIFRKG